MQGLRKMPKNATRARIESIPFLPALHFSEFFIVCTLRTTGWKPALKLVSVSVLADLTTLTSAHQTSALNPKSFVL